ncbi:MAG: RHS repeat-associated core domain-containing protein [Nitrosomonadaceae bacterium]
MKKYILTILGVIGYFTFGMTSLSAREVYALDATPRATTAIENQLGFNCSYHDEESNLVYKRARYYSPDKGVFISRDQLEYADGMSMHQYVRSNPFKYTDSTGHGGEVIGTDIPGVRNKNTDIYLDDHDLWTFTPSFSGSRMSKLQYKTKTTYRVNKLGSMVFGFLQHQSNLVKTYRDWVRGEAGRLFDQKTLATFYLENGRCYCKDDGTWEMQRQYWDSDNKRTHNKIYNNSDLTWEINGNKLTVTVLIEHGYASSVTRNSTTSSSTTSESSQTVSVPGYEVGISDSDTNSSSYSASSTSVYKQEWSQPIQTIYTCIPKLKLAPVATKIGDMTPATICPDGE